MSRVAFCIVCALTVPAVAIAQPSAPGDVMFVGYNADGTDGFAILTLVDIPDTTVIHFSDNEWDGTSAFVDTNEGEATWTNDTGGTITEGTVLIFTSMSSSPTASLGSMSGENVNLNASDEQLWAYLGTATVPTTFLGAIANDDFSVGGNSIANTGLTVGTDAIEGDDLGWSDDDVAVYIGVNHCDGLTQVQCQQQIASVGGNWDSDEGGGNQDQDATFPDFPDDVVSDFTTVPVELMTFSID